MKKTRRICKKAEKRVCIKKKDWRVRNEERKRSAIDQTLGVDTALEFFY